MTKKKSTDIAKNNDKKKHGNRGGRPAKYATAVELQRAIDKYFNATPQDDWMISGLAVHLGISPSQLFNYETGQECQKRGFVDVIKIAKAKIAREYERMGKEKGRVFDIFRLKCIGYRDGSERATASGVQVNIGIQSLSLSPEDRAFIRSLRGKIGSNRDTFPPKKLSKIITIDDNAIDTDS
jgi:hypothetical protein